MLLHRCFECLYKPSASPLVLGWYGAVMVWLIPFPMQNCLTSSAVNCGPLPVMIWSGIPYLDLRMSIVSTGHCNNLWLFGASIDYDEPHLFFKRNGKINMKPLPGLLWHFPWISWISLILLTGLALFGLFLNVLVNLRPPDMSPCQ